MPILIWIHRKYWPICRHNISLNITLAHDKCREFLAQRTHKKPTKRIEIGFVPLKCNVNDVHEKYQIVFDIECRIMNGIIHVNGASHINVIVCHLMIVLYLLCHLIQYHWAIIITFIKIKIAYLCTVQWTKSAVNRHLILNYFISHSWESTEKSVLCWLFYWQSFDVVIHCYYRFWTVLSIVWRATTT